MAAQQTIDFGATYPTRPPYYFSTFLRLVDRLAVIQDVGPIGFALLSHIVLTEDRRRYQGPPKFFKTGLCDRLGVSEVETISAAIDRCVAAGWLHWEKPRSEDGRERQRCRAVAWVKVPLWADDEQLDRPENPVTVSDRPENPVNHPVNHPVTSIPIPLPSKPNPTTTEWDAAAAAVRESGITDWQRPLRDAAKNGLAPQAVLDLIAHWRSVQTLLQSPLGALHYALRHAEPRHVAGDWLGLLPISDEVLRLRRRAEREAEQRRHLVAAPKAAPGDTSPELRLRQLEIRFDAELKGQKIGDIVKRCVVPDAIVKRLALFHDQRWSGSLRMAEPLKLALLEHLAAASMN